jgi:hypothetical protein
MVQSQGEALAWHALSSSQAWAGACMVVGARAHLFVWTGMQQALLLQHGNLAA